MAKKAGAQYLQSPTVQKKSIRGRLSTMLAASAALIAIAGSLLMGGLVAGAAADDRPVATTAEAVGMNLCGVIGLEMDGRHGWKAGWDVTLPDLGNRRFMLSEVVPNSLWWSNFSGTGTNVGDQFAVSSWDDEVEAANNGRSGNTLLPTSDQLPGALQSFRNTGQCLWTPAPGVLGGLGLNFANFISKITSFVATSAFNSSFICDADTAPGPGSNCIDLVSILGGRSNDAGQGGSGEGGNSGVIGNLTTGLYKPLMVIVVLVTALTVFWTGIVKRRFREAFFQAIWLALSVIIGLALLLNPSMLVKAPMVAGNTVLGCIVGAFNGSGCTGGGTTPDAAGTPTTAKDNVCKVDANGSLEQKTTLYISSMGCSIWSAFVLEPYAQGAYGVSLSQLDLDSVIDPSSGQTVRELMQSPGWNPGGTGSTDAGNPNAICVNLQTNTSYNGMGATFQGRSETSSGSAGAICNLAVWDLFMKTTAVGGGVTSANNNPDNQWLTVLSRLPANEALFATYTNQSGSWGKFGMGSLAWITALLSGGMLIAVSALALVYYLIAIIMVAFAPVFFLFGMHPGRGKKIMLGWVEQVVSNLLKYVVSAVFLLIAITFYGAILGTATDFFTAILFVVLINVALLMYRKELIGLLSRVDMGGEKMADLASSVTDGARGVNNWLAPKGRALAAGAIAGAATGGAAGVGAGLKAATMRELRQGNSFTARTFQAASALSTDNENDLYKTEKAKRDQANIAQKETEERESEAISSANELKQDAQRISDARAKVANAVTKDEELQTLANDKQDLNQSLMVEFTENSDWGRAHRSKVDSNGVTSVQALKDITETQGQLSKIDALRAQQEAAGDTEGLKRTAEVQVNLKTKLDGQINDFQRNHGVRGSTEAFSDLLETKDSLENIAYRRDEAKNAGDVENYEKYSKAYVELEGRLELKKEVFSSVYGSDAEGKAQKAFDAVGTNFVRNIEDDETREKFERAQNTDSKELAQERSKAAQAVQNARLEENRRVDEFNEKRTKLDGLLDQAAQARSNSEFLKAEADSLSESRKNLTPGEILTNKKAAEMEEKARLGAGVQAARSAEFGSRLTERIEEINTLTMADDKTTDDNSRVSKISTKVESKGEILTDIERANPGKVSKYESEAIEKAAQERADKIRQLEREAREAERIKRQSEREESGKSGIFDIQGQMRQQEARNAEAARQWAEKKQQEAKEQYEKAASDEIYYRATSPNASAAAKEASDNAAQILAEAKEKLANAEKQLYESTERANDARRAVNEGRKTVEADIAAANARNAREAADAAGSRFTKPIEPSTKFMESRDVAPAQKRDIEELAAKVNSLASYANRGVLDADVKARIAELDKQLTNLSGPLSDNQVKALKKFYNETLSVATKPSLTDVAKNLLPSSRPSATEQRKPEEPREPRAQERDPKRGDSSDNGGRPAGGLGAAIANRKAQRPSDGGPSER